MQAATGTTLQEHSRQQVLLENPMPQQSAQGVNRVLFLLDPPGVGGVESFQQQSGLVALCVDAPVDPAAQFPDRHVPPPTPGPERVPNLERGVDLFLVGGFPANRHEFFGHRIGRLDDELATLHGHGYPCPLSRFGGYRQQAVSKRSHSIELLQ